MPGKILQSTAASGTFRSFLIGMLLGLCPVVASASCPQLPAEPKAFLKEALDFFARSSAGGDAKIPYGCVHQYATAVFNSGFERFYTAEADNSVRLIAEAPDMQRRGQRFASRQGDSTAERNLFNNERELRTHAIQRLSVLQKPPVTELIRHYSNLVSVLAQFGDAQGIVQTVGSVRDTDWLDEEVRFNYLRAVASCPAWDVSSADNIDSVILGERMKTAQCSDAADDAMPLACAKSSTRRMPKLDSLLRKFSKAGKRC